MEKKLTVQFPTQGWSQILTSRKEILDAYDRAREHARAEEVETLHGRVLEASVRAWLQDFLPKRYGVTSGFVASPGLSSDAKVPHFDVIIYDQLESPVLWVTKNLDNSEQGRSRAIPVEYVRFIIEIKSSFSASNIRHAINHLADLLLLLSGVDALGERYKLYLPPSFGCCLLFAELRKLGKNTLPGLGAMIQGSCIRGFYGGVILRSTGDVYPNTGLVQLMLSQTPIKPFQGIDFAVSESEQVSNSQYIGTVLNWFEANFARFAFDLVAVLQGKFDPTKVSSFYGFGQSPRPDDASN